MKAETEWKWGEGWAWEDVKPCKIKCCKWERTRLDQEYRFEIESRLKLFGSLMFGRHHALIVGWAVAKGQDPDEARHFATHILHH